MSNRKLPEISKLSVLGKRAAGFTLVELMIVLAILGILSVLTALGVASMSKASQVDAAGSLISNLLTNARSDAISHGRLVQLRVATNWSSDPSLDYRKLSIWIRPLPDDLVQPVAGSSDQFVQFSRWQTLPEGIIVENSADPTKASPPYSFTSSPGVYFLSTSLGNTTSGVQVGGGTTANFA